MVTPFIVTKSTKSIGIAILLTFLFGPIGLFYASVTGGFIMTFTPIFLGLFVFVGFAQENLLLLGWSFGLLTIFAMTFWLINIIWAVIGVTSYNQEIEDEAKRQFALWNLHHQTNPNQIVFNIQQKPSHLNPSRQKTIELSTQPNLQDWLERNPGKSINDYFIRFGR